MHDFWSKKWSKFWCKKPLILGEGKLIEKLIEKNDKKGGVKVIIKRAFIFALFLIRKTWKVEICKKNAKSRKPRNFYATILFNWYPTMQRKLFLDFIFELGRTFLCISRAVIFGRFGTPFWIVLGSFLDWKGSFFGTFLGPFWVVFGSFFGPRTGKIAQLFGNVGKTLEKTYLF